MKKIILAAALILSLSGLCFAAENLLIDDFEVAVSGGPEGTVDFGSGNGSTVNVTAATDIKNTGKQSIKIDYDAVQGGYIYVARGNGLDAKYANWPVNPDAIKWDEYKGFSFYMYGTDSKAKVAFDIKDNSDEIWRFVVEDNFKGWKQIVCDFDKFIVRDDWQPESADKNMKLDFPVKIFQFEPLPVSKGTLYVDTVELVKK
jgi:Carbohydrate binding domain (family 11)